MSHNVVIYDSDDGIFRGNLTDGCDALGFDVKMFIHTYITYIHITHTYIHT